MELPQRTGITLRRAIALFLTVTVALFMQSLDSTIVATALSDIRADLSTSLAWSSWTITIYAAVMMTVLPMAANLCKQYKPKSVFLTSLIIFTIASLACALSANVILLIFFRAIQAVGGAGLTPSATAIIVESFGPSRDKALGFFGMIFQTGSIVGPVIGGLFVTYSTWRWIFLVNVPVGLMVAILGFRLIPGSTVIERRRSQPLLSDISGLTLLTAAVMVFMIFSIVVSDQRGSFRVSAYLMFLISIALFIFFYKHIIKTPQPFIEPRLVIGRGFGAINVINLVHGGVPIGLLSLVPLYGMTRYQLSALVSAGLLAVSSVAAIICGFFAVLLLRKFGYLVPLYINGSLTVVGLGVIAISPPFRIEPELWLVIGSALIGAGRGVSQPAARNTSLQILPEESAAIAALRTMGRRIGMVIAVAGVTAVASIFNDQGEAIGLAFAGFAVLVMATVPVIRYIPDHRGRW